MKHVLDLKPFIVPNFVLAKHPSRNGDDISIPIEQLSDEAIDDLCKEFCAAIKKKKQPIVKPRGGTIINPRD